MVSPAFFSLFDTLGFEPEWHRSGWTALHGWTHIIADAAIWAAFTCIPIILVWHCRRHPELRTAPILRLFLAFILACGATHALDAVTFWWPIYRISALAKIVTAIASWATVLVMMRYASTAIDLPGLRRINDQLRDELEKRQEAEARVRVREAHLNAIVESTPDILITIDERGRIDSANGAAQRRWQRTAAELQGVDFESMLIPERFHEEYRRTLAAGGTAGAPIEIAVLRADGGEYAAELLVCPIRANRRKLFVIQVRDITDRKRSEEKFRAAVEFAPNAKIMNDLNGRIVLVNSKAEQLFGYTRAELLAGTIAMLLPDVQYSLDVQPRALGVGRDLFARHKSGRLIPVEIGLNPIPTEQGTFFLTAIVDITERKRLEQELARQADLLRAKNANLEHRNQELDEFSYVASHDLQEPLRKLISFSKLLSTDMPSALPEKAALDLHFITEAAARMQNLIQDSLALSRTGRAALRHETVRLDDCVDRALDALATQVQERNPEIVRDPLPTIIGDPVLIGQLYQNLIGNALKFIAPGARPVLHLTCEHKNGELILGVRDNGIGLKPQYAETIFAPFKRLHGRDEYPGSGIGLSICRKVAELHGGRIWVESQLGEGAHFKFALRPGEVG